MALDKQKILNELGNVVNQLQSADCGCMGKLFSNSNQPNRNGGVQNAPMISPAHDGGMRSCCHGHGCGHGYHRYNAPGAGEPFSGHRNCMGCCNPPKLYADTYNYLNNNLMQPVVKEVYDDLKSISPANTMMNNPMGAKMGLSPSNPTAPGAMGGQKENMGQNQMPGGAMGNQNAMSNQHHGPNVRFANSNMGNNMQMSNTNGPQQINQHTPLPLMPGMGPNIMNMMMGDAAARRVSNPNQGGTQGGIIDNNIPQSSEIGQYNGGMPGNNPEQYNNMTQGYPGASMQNSNPYGGMPSNNPGQYNNMTQGNPSAPIENSNPHGGMPGNNPGQYNDLRPGYPGAPMQNFNPHVGMPSNNPGQYNNMRQSNPGASIQNSNPLYMSQPNMNAGENTNMQGNTMNGEMGHMNPGSQQMQAMTPAQPQMNAQSPGYGQHGAGMAKFNEMFPGVMQGGDLGFDPMAIAIQMNPANQQSAAMNTMQKMMMSNGNGLNANAPLLQPVINATNAAMANISQAPTNQVPGQQSMAPTSMQQQIPGASAAAVPVQNNQVPPQQAYTTLTGSPTMNQQQVLQQQIPSQQQQYQGQYQQQQQQLVDPKTGAVVAGTLPTVYEGSENPNARQGGSLQNPSAPPTTQQIIKEPIFPAETSRNLPPAYSFNKFKQQHYNTLGQPINMLPADIYRIPEPQLPQTLSPQTITRSDPGRYSNVKATVSKTSLMGIKPLGGTPSRGQLQQVYNTYKGSQSFTQQNIRPSDNGASYSDGHLNVTQVNAVPQTPIERIGGDTAANNAMPNLAYTAGEKPGQGDIPAANKPLGDGPPADAEKAPMKNSAIRNGLQDMKYTAYTTSAAWSFHGDTPAPRSLGTYRFRYKV